MSKNKKKRTICVIASSRATYGYKRNILLNLQKDKSINLKVIVTGMHLSKKHGYSINDLKKDKIKIYKKLKIDFSKDKDENFVSSLGFEIAQLSKVFNKIKPDILLVTGDRAEMFAATVSAVYMGIPVAHIQAGDLSGHIDGSARHAITKLSHIHFASCFDSANRVKKLGEQTFRIFNTGAPQLDDFKNYSKEIKAMTLKSIHPNLKKDFFIIMQHPVLYDKINSGSQIEETLKASIKFKNQKIVIYPNIDSGNDKIIQIINKYCKKDRGFILFKNLDRKKFIFLLSKAKILLGNSSCGILESSWFKLPTINIGDRQRGRLQSKNIFNCDYSAKNIEKKINLIFKNKNYINKIKSSKNLYGDGKSSLKIIKILKKIKINKKLLDKINTF